jgi:hypothetical protein
VLGWESWIEGNGMKKVRLICFLIFLSKGVLGQKNKKLFIEMKDTLSLSKANQVIYHNETNDTVYVNVSVYDAKTHVVAIENLFNKGSNANFAMAVAVKVLQPRTSLTEVVPAHKFLGYKMKKGEYLFKAVFNSEINGKSRLAGVFEKRAFIK